MFNNDQPTKITKLLFKSEARTKLFAGIDKAAKAVSSTLGPMGKTVLIRQGGSQPIATKDGVTVSKAICLKDPVERMGADLVKEAASQTNESAGDGTTTATVLTHALIVEGMKLLEANWSARALIRGMKVAGQYVDESLTVASHSITTREETAQIATISANGDTVIGDLIAEAFDKVGKNGVITVEDAKGMQTSLSIVEGMQFDRGYVSPYFVTNPEKMNATYNDTKVLIVDKKISSIRELVPVLERVMQAGHSLLIIAEEIEGEALQGLVLNRVKGNLPVVAIRSPGYGKHREELLGDICALSGASLVSPSTGLRLEDVQLSQLGTVKKVVVDAKSTTLVATGATAGAVQDRVVTLTEQLNDVTLTTEDVSKLKLRLAKLSSGVAVIKVGGATEVEMIERKYRIEDALNATKAAADEGIILGGGTVLARISSLGHKDLSQRLLAKPSSEEEMGMKLVFAACAAPLRKIAENAGVSASVIMHRLAQETGPTVGYNAADDVFEDLFKAGVVDPVKVTRMALKNAISVATTFMLLDAVIVEEEGQLDGQEQV